MYIERAINPIVHCPIPRNLSLSLMEPLCKLKNDTLHNINNHKLPSTVLSKHVKSTLLEILRFASLSLFLCIESFFILQKWKPIFHLLLFSFFPLYFFILNRYFISSPPSIYLVDFSCLKPPNYCRVPFSFFLESASMIESFDQESIAFMAKTIYSSGQSEQTYLPPALHCIPPNPSYQESIKEVHLLLFPIMDNLLSKTHVSPRDIDILIVNCSGFCPNPSLSSIVVNKYSMRSDIKSYNLSGMGCGAGALAIDLAKNLLQVHENSYAIVLSTEILSTGWYAGNERSMLGLNCLFRMGSAAILLTNKKEARNSSKYKLFRSLRTTRAFENSAYFSAFREEDSKGITGVKLGKDVLHAVGETLKTNISILGSSILPFSEKLWYLVSYLRKKYVDKDGEIYVPNFKSVVKHFCLPTSGKVVIRNVGRALELGERHMEAASMTLHRFGNQSSSSWWYVLAYIEAKERVKKGDKVWQVVVGTGIKCNSVVWECIRPIVGEFKTGPWADCIDKYPISSVDDQNS